MGIYLLDPPGALGNSNLAGVPGKKHSSEISQVGAGV